MGEHVEIENPCSRCGHFREPVGEVYPLAGTMMRKTHTGWEPDPQLGARLSPHPTGDESSASDSAGGHPPSHEDCGCRVCSSFWSESEED